MLVFAITAKGDTHMTGIMGVNTGGEGLMH